MTATRPSLLLLAALAATPAVAAPGCAQERAIYTSDEGGYRLAFHPAGAAAGGVVSHLFSLSKADAVLDGLVMPADEPARTVARIMKDCPDGDVTGEDLAACTGFEGYVYAISATGGVGNLGAPDAEAAPVLLLAGLGPTLAGSALTEKLKLGDPTSDGFTFRECAP